MITACGQDFAIVSSAMLFLTSVEDEVNCKDSTGAAVGLPDMGAIVTGVAQWCSPVAYPVTPSPLDCATKDQTSADLLRQRGPVEVRGEGEQGRPARRIPDPEPTARTRSAGRLCSSRRPSPAA